MRQHFTSICVHGHPENHSSYNNQSDPVKLSFQLCLCQPLNSPNSHEESLMHSSNIYAKIELKDEFT